MSAPASAGAFAVFWHFAPLATLGRAHSRVSLAKLIEGIPSKESTSIQAFGYQIANQDAAPHGFTPGGAFA